PPLRQTRKPPLVGRPGAALLLPLIVCAEAALNPVPTPDTSPLDPAKAKQLADDRAQFDKGRAPLVGPPLAQAYADLGVLYVRAGFKDAGLVALYDATQADPLDARWLYLRG